MTGPPIVCSVNIFANLAWCIALILQGKSAQCHSLLQREKWCLVQGQCNRYRCMIKSWIEHSHSGFNTFGCWLKPSCKSNNVLMHCSLNPYISEVRKLLSACVCALVRVPQLCHMQTMCLTANMHTLMGGMCLTICVGTVSYNNNKQQCNSRDVASNEADEAVASSLFCALIIKLAHACAK